MCEHKNGESFTFGLVVGALLGAVAGVLLAPASGEETREVLINESAKAKKQLKKKMAAVAEAAEPYLDDLAEQWDELAEATHDKVDEVKENVQDFVAEHEPEVRRQIKQVKKATRPLKKLFADKNPF